MRFMFMFFLSYSNPGILTAILLAMDITPVRVKSMHIVHVNETFYRFR